jgi:hypothetical protein
MVCIWVKRWFLIDPEPGLAASLWIIRRPFMRVLRRASEGREGERDEGQALAVKVNFRSPRLDVSGPATTVEIARAAEKN